MPTRDLKWYGALPTPSEKSLIRRCILNFTSEATDPLRIFGMFHNDPDLRDGTLPFTYKSNRLFLAVFREDFFVVFEDHDLNIRALIEELWDCNPVKHVELPFGDYFDNYMLKLSNSTLNSFINV